MVIREEFSSPRRTRNQLKQAQEETIKTINETVQNESTQNKLNNPDNRTQESQSQYKAPNTECYMDLEDFGKIFPQLKETDAWYIIKLYFEHRQLNETKLHSFNRLVQETIPRIIKNLPSLVVKHGFDWHQFKYLDVIKLSLFII